MVSLNSLKAGGKTNQKTTTLKQATIALGEMSNQPYPPPPPPKKERKKERKNNEDDHRHLPVTWIINLRAISLYLIKPTDLEVNRETRQKRSRLSTFAPRETEDQSALFALLGISCMRVRDST